MKDQRPSPATFAASRRHAASIVCVMPPQNIVFQARRQRGMTRDDLASALGILLPEAIRLENGADVLSSTEKLEVLRRISDFAASRPISEANPVPVEYTCSCADSRLRADCRHVRAVLALQSAESQGE